MELDKKFPSTTIKKFLSTINKPGVGEFYCWEWQGLIDWAGYGRFSYKDADGKTRQIKAHRLSWWIATGTDPEEYTLKHTCESRSCCNPQHIEAQKNDWQRGNTAPHKPCSGTKHWSTRLTEETVRTILFMYKNGNMSVRKIAAHLKLPKSTVGDILSGHTWKNNNNHI